VRRGSDLFQGAATGGGRRREFLDPSKRAGGTEKGCQTRQLIAAWCRVKPEAGCGTSHQEVLVMYYTRGVPWGGLLKVEMHNRVNSVTEKNWGSCRVGWPQRFPRREKKKKAPRKNPRGGGGSKKNLNT